MITNRALLLLLRVWRDRRGQDLIEYALMAGFVAGRGWRHYARSLQQHQHHI